MSSVGWVGRAHAFENRQNKSVVVYMLDWDRISMQYFSHSLNYLNLSVKQKSMFSHSFLCERAICFVIFLFWRKCGNHYGYLVNKHIVVSFAVQSQYCTGFFLVVSTCCLVAKIGLNVKYKGRATKCIKSTFIFVGRK